MMYAVSLCLFTVPVVSLISTFFSVNFLISQLTDLRQEQAHVYRTNRVSVRFMTHPPNILKKCAVLAFLKFGNFCGMYFRDVCFNVVLYCVKLVQFTGPFITLELLHSLRFFYIQIRDSDTCFSQN